MYYRLHGSHLQALIVNTNKILVAVENTDADFRLSDSVYGVVSNAVLPNEATEEVMNNDKIGEKLHKVSNSQRLLGSLSLWSPTKCCSLSIFKNK